MTGDSAARRRRLLAASEAEAFALDAVWRAEVEGLIGRMREKAAGLPRVVAERPPVIARLPRWVPVVYWSVAASLALAFVVALPPRRPASRRNGGCGTWDEREPGSGLFAGRDQLEMIMSCGLSVEQMLAIGAALCGVVAILLVLLVVHPVSRMRHAPIMIGCCLAVMAITVVGCGAMVSPVALPRAPVALSILLLSAILGIVVALMVRHLLVRQGPPAGPADAVAAALERIAQDANCEFGTVWGDLGAQRRNALRRVHSGSAELSIPGKATLYQAIREVADELGVDRPFWLPDSDQLA